MAQKKRSRERRKRYVAPELKKGENLRRITAQGTAAPVTFD